MRPRKRAEWPIRVYKYSIRPEYNTWEQLPIEARQETEQARALWNSLVEVFQQRQIRYRELNPLGEQQTNGVDKPAIRQALTQLQQSFLAEARQVTAQSSVTWAYREFILTQFLATVTRFLRRQGKAPQRKHGEPTELHFHHRFAGGGFAVEKIFGHSQRLSLAPVSLAAFDDQLSQRQRKRCARTHGTFQVGTMHLPFQVLLHRPLPPGGLLKSAALIGKQVVPSGFRDGDNGGCWTAAQWAWSLQLTVEQPPSMTEPGQQPVLQGTLLLSRRLWNESQLQVGILVDSTGREEALLLPEAVLTAWYHKRELQRQADHSRDQTKSMLQDLRKHPQLHGTANLLLAHVGQMENAGLWRMLRHLDDPRMNDEIGTIVRCWADRQTRLQRETRGLERRYLGQRDWFYRNLASQLCHRYQQIVIAPEPLPSVIPNAHPTTERQDDEGTYRHLAAPSVFLSFLQQAATKTGTQIKASSTYCHSSAST